MPVVVSLHWGMFCIGTRDSVDTVDGGNQRDKHSEMINPLVSRRNSVVKQTDVGCSPSYIVPLCFNCKVSPLDSQIRWTVVVGNMSTWFNIVLLVLIIVIDHASRWSMRLRNDRSTRCLDATEERFRPMRSFGCDGMNNRNEDRCRWHCRNFGYRSGRCDALFNYKTCTCYRSVLSH